MNLSPTADVDLMTRIAKHDATALRDLYDKYGRIAFALAYRITGEAAAAEEIVQDAFVAAWSRAASFQEHKGGNVRGWLLSIVHNRSIDYRRKEIDRGPGNTAFDLVENTLATPDAWGDVAAQMDADDVRMAMAELPPDQRRTIELSFFDGLSHAEIAAQENASLGTVKGRIRLGLKKLSASLDPGFETAGTVS
jgi:RNA polymerase sigma-70 factor (ECF subfamily)